MQTIKDSKIIILGGGGIGCGIAYSLCQAGITEVLLLEKNNALATETTSQGAGLVGQLRNDLNRVALAKWSVKIFTGLEKKAVKKPAWMQVGSLRIALTENKAHEFEILKSTATEAGVNVNWITNKEANKKWPLFDFSSVKGVLWCDTDGYLSPSKLAESYANESMKLGAKFETGILVEEIMSSNGKVTGVRTNKGTICCDILINAAGAHAWHIAKMAGLNLPVFPVRHEYFISSAIENVNPNLPTMRIPEASLYLRASNNSLLLGGWEPDCVYTDPKNFKNGEKPPMIKDDLNVMKWFKDQLKVICPKNKIMHHSKVYKGWPTFVPDGRFIVGPTKKLQGFIMAGGCNAHGISGSAGIGKHVVDSIYSEEKSEYLKSLSPDRFLIDEKLNWEQEIEKSQMIYKNYYN